MSSPTDCDINLDIDIENPHELVEQESSDPSIAVNSNATVTLTIEDILRLTTVQNDEDVNESKRDFQNVDDDADPLNQTTVQTAVQDVDVDADAPSSSKSPKSERKKTKRTKSGGSPKKANGERKTEAIESDENMQSKVIVVDSPESIERAGAVAVFPSDSEHITQRRSATNHRISDADPHDEEAQMQPTTTSQCLDFTLEEIPEPPQSQVIHAVATYQQQNVRRSLTEGTTGSNSLNAPSNASSNAPSNASRDTSRDASRNTIAGNTVPNDSESGTVMATAVSTENYYAEVRRQLRQEAVAAVAVVQLNDHNLPKEKDENDRKSIHKYAWLGCCLGLVVVVVLIAVATYRKKFNINTKEQGSFEECGDDSGCYMQLMWNTDLGSYWRARIAKILPRSLLEGLLTDTDYSSPRQQAFYFLVKNADNFYGVDNMVAMGNEELDPLEKERILTYYALATIYYALGGDSWHVTLKWLNPDEDFCHWYGIECRAPSVEEPEAFPSDIAAPPPAFTALGELQTKSPGQFFSLRNIDLSQNNLWGKIPSEIMLLSNMNGMLLLSDNGISGSIPSEITMLTNLEGFDIRNNKFFSTIPPEMSRMTDLRVFDVSSNIYVSGEPIQFENWEKIEKLELQGTKVQGAINSNFCDMIESRESGDVPFQFTHTEEFVFRSNCHEFLKCPCCTECCKSDHNTLTNVCVPNVI